MIPIVTCIGWLPSASTESLKTRCAVYNVAGDSWHACIDFATDFKPAYTKKVSHFGKPVGARNHEIVFVSTPQKQKTENISWKVIRMRRRETLIQDQKSIPNIQEHHPMQFRDPLLRAYIISSHSFSPTKSSISCKKKRAQLDNNPCSRTIKILIL